MPTRARRTPSRRSRFRVERRGMSMPPPYDQPRAQEGFQVWGRGRAGPIRGSRAGKPESLCKKQMILPETTNSAPRDLVWADARFAVDILGEHSLFFSMLMPSQVAPDEKQQAQGFHQTHLKLFQTSGIVLYEQ